MKKIQKERSLSAIDRLRIDYLKICKGIGYILVHLFHHPANSFKVLAKQKEDGTWEVSYVEHLGFVRRLKRLALSGAVFVVVVAIATLALHLLFPDRPISRAASYTWDIPNDAGYGWSDNLSPTAHADIPDSNPYNASAASGSLRLTNKTTRWTQTDWSGGDGQTSWSDATKFSSSSNIDYDGTAGQISLDRPSTAFTEDFTATTYRDSVNTEGIWETTRDTSRARVNTENPQLYYLGGEEVKDVVTTNVLGQNQSYAVVENFILKNTVDGGTGWTTVYTRNTDSDSEKFTAISMANPNTIVAGTEDGYLYYSNDAGASFNSAGQQCGGTAVNDIEFVRDLSCGSECIAWVACEGGGGDDQGDVEISTDSGVNWTAKDASYFVNVNSVAPVSAAEAWIVGRDNSFVLHTINGGDDWNSSNNLDYYTRAVTYDGSSKIWASGAGGRVWISTDEGANFTLQTSGTPDAYLEDVLATSSTVVYSAAEDGTIIKTTNGGTNWDTQTSGTSSQINHLSAEDANNVMYAGDGAILAYTLNGGTDWSPIWSNMGDFAGKYFFNVTSANENNIWIGGYDAGTIFYSSDGGDTWTDQSDNTPCKTAPDIVKDLFAVYDTSCTSDCIVYAACNSNIYKTTDSGSNWSAQGNPEMDVYLVAGTVDGVIYASTGDGGSLKRYEGGSWSANLNPTATAIRGVEVYDDTTAWAVGESGLIIATTNGTAWTEQDSTYSDRIHDIDALSADLVYAAGKEGYVFYTTDGGSTWTKEQECGSHVMGISAFSTELIIMVAGEFFGGGNNFWVTSDGGDTWTQTNYPGTFEEAAWISPTEQILVGSVDGDTEGGIVIKRQSTLDISEGQIQSSTIDSTDDTIVAATMTPNVSLNGQTADYYLSADGSNWEEVTGGEEHTFSNTGSDLRWRVDLQQDDPGSDFAELTEVQVSYKGNYYDSGALTSSIYSFGAQATEWGNVGWTETLNGETLTMKARTSNSATMVGATAFSSCDGLTNNADISGNNCVTDGHQYIQYQANLSTANPDSATPVLKDVTFDTKIYGSIYFDLDASGTSSWVEQVSSETLDSADINVKYRFKTAASQAALPAASWSSWYNGEENDLTGLDPSRFLRVEARIESTDVDGTDDGDLDGFTIQRSQNGRPSFQAAPSVTQASDGDVEVSYSLKDSDADEGSYIPDQNDVYFYYNRGVTLNEALTSSDTTITVSDGSAMPASGTIYIETACAAFTSCGEIITYTGVSSNDLTGATRRTDTPGSSTGYTHDLGDTIWVKAVTTSGTGLKDVTGAYSSFSGAWTAATDYAGVYTSSQQLMVLANDRELVYNTEASAATTFTLDTTDPVAGATPISINAASAKTNDASVTLTLSASDDSSLLMSFSNDNTTYGTVTDEDGGVTNSGSWETYNTSKAWTLTSGNDGTRTVYVKYKDSVANEIGPYNDTITYDSTANDIISNLDIDDASDIGIERFRLILNWDPIIAASNPDFDHYLLEVSTDGTDYSEEATFSDITEDNYLDKNLTQSQRYYYRVKSVDNADNESFSSTVVTDVPGDDDNTPPDLSGEAPVAVCTTSACTVAWTTDESATSCVQYGETTDYGDTECELDFVTSHEVAISGLTSGTEYHYRVISKDAVGNQATGDDYTMTTRTSTDDTTPPQVSAEGPIVSPSSATAIVAWSTDEEADSYVEFGLTTDYDYLQGSDELDTDHAITLIGLESQKTYNFRIKSTDAAGNTATSGNYQFTTTLPADADNPPVISGIETQAPGVSTSSVTVTWTTNSYSTSKVLYGTTGELGQATEEDAVLTRKHYVTVTDLSAGTTYYYQVKSEDTYGNVTTSDTGTFTTAAEEVITDPEISDIEAQTPGAAATTVTIIWTTDTDTTSQVLYGTTTDLGSESAKDTTYTKKHFFTLTGLTPNTKYYYKVKSEDAHGNVSLSDLKTFITTQPLVGSPQISGVEVSDISLNSAIISWQSFKITTSDIQYGTAADYGSSIVDLSDSLTTQHVVRMSGLDSGAAYHFRIYSQDKDGKSVASDDYVFNTLALPQISAVDISQIKDKQAVVSWSTNVNTDGVAEYGADENYGLSQGLSDYSTSHKLTLIGLEPSTLYHLRVKGRDALGNLGQSGDYTFRTKIDSDPPQIADIQFESSTIATGQDGVNILVSWVTDEPSTSQVLYHEGLIAPSDSDAYELKTKEDQSYNMSHMVVLPRVKPSVTYHFRVRSVDQFNNPAVSDDYVVVTPPKTRSILADILASLESRFIWLAKIKELFGF